MGGSIRPVVKPAVCYSGYTVSEKTRVPRTRDGTAGIIRCPLANTVDPAFNGNRTYARRCNSDCMVSGLTPCTSHFQRVVICPTLVNIKTSPYTTTPITQKDTITTFIRVTPTRHMLYIIIMCFRNNLRVFSGTVIIIRSACIISPLMLGKVALNLQIGDYTSAIN